ncbi:MAG TPA: GFA family protein [Steroidobacteraceae bacterium]|nr:GFA family protein [Steroidobacteraceae bacterium]
MEPSTHTGTWVLPKESYSARVNGACLCGAVTWSYDGPFQAMFHCHCSVCRKHHGTLFVTTVVGALTTFHWRTGTEKIGTWQSSPHERRAFCTVCGSKVPRVELESQRVFMPAGALTGELGIRPQMHLFAGSKAAGYTIADGLPQHDEYPPGWGATGLPTPARPSREGVVSGSCACNAVRFELAARPKLMRHCHCGRCQHARGGAHATNIVWPLDGASYLSGEEKVVDFPLPGAQFFGVAFCADCGGALPRKSVGRGFLVVPVGSLDADPEIHPHCHQYVSSKAPWYEIHDGVPQFADAPPLPK